MSDRYELRGDCLIDTLTQSLVYDDVAGRAGELLCDKMNEHDRLEGAVREYLSAYVLKGGEFYAPMDKATGERMQAGLKKLAGMV